MSLYTFANQVLLTVTIAGSDGPRLLLHTGANSVLEAKRLADVAIELRMDGVLASAPPIFRAPDLDVRPNLHESMFW